MLAKIFKIKWNVNDILYNFNMLHCGTSTSQFMVRAFRLNYGESRRHKGLDKKADTVLGSGDRHAKCRSGLPDNTPEEKLIPIPWKI